MLTIIQGDITKVQTDAKYIVNASNGFGIMPSGVAGAIKNAGGLSIEFDAFRKCFLNIKRPGSLFVTHAGSLPFRHVIHLVTMVFPGMPSKLTNIEKCLHSLIEYSRANHIQKVALPALGTGVGSLNKKEVAELYKNLLGLAHDIEFIVIDKDEEFIKMFF